MRSADLEVGQEYMLDGSNDWERSRWGQHRIRIVRVPVRPWAKRYGGGYAKDADGNKFENRDGRADHAEVEYLHPETGELLPNQRSWGQEDRVPVRLIRETWADTQQRYKDIKERNKRNKEHAEEERKRRANNQTEIEALNVYLASFGLELSKYSLHGKVSMRPVSDEDMTEQQMVAKTISNLAAMARDAQQWRTDAEKVAPFITCIECGAEELDEKGTTCMECGATQ